LCNIKLQQALNDRYPTLGHKPRNKLTYSYLKTKNIYVGDCRSWSYDERRDDIVDWMEMMRWEKSYPIERHATYLQDSLVFHRDPAKTGLSKKSSAPFCDMMKTVSLGVNVSTVQLGLKTRVFGRIHQATADNQVIARAIFDFVVDVIAYRYHEAAAAGRHGGTKALCYAGDFNIIQPGINGFILDRQGVGCSIDDQVIEIGADAVLLYALQLLDGSAACSGSPSG
jgi:hypothetical protein